MKNSDPVSPGLRYDTKEHEEMPELGLERIPQVKKEPACAGPARFMVKVDDNFHSGDGGGGYAVCSYSDLEGAIEMCEWLTIKSLKGFYEKGMDAGKLSAQWAMFGEDPYIIGGTGGKPRFSARQFISAELCSKIIEEMERKA